ncbi:Cullin-associated NEDD8-dissociated protein 1, C-terminal part [Lachnellula arida]|uniref:Cullin-associated NEDD8-dissociated protein 1, C-terminal part n=2 Tax=Lachnellula TaxID=47830 RepID=A0A8T9BD13_9HELO|nr:Cullin-associated NEDD8-dissociated protein 1, C-terminal part [Lachnellula arida]TVY92778.1 Cullin-associated NEDD8-dissociated protein, C-terminal part [Lachnellula willkommii]
MSTQTPPNPTSNTVAALLPKLHDNDPDFRFMSLNDLFNVLNNGKADFLHNDYNTAARTVDGVLKTLDDQNGEVQNLAIKCLAPLVLKLPSSILAPLIEKLSNLSTENSVDNSIPAMALRTVVITLPRPVSGVAAGKEVSEAYAAISRVLIPRLVGRIVNAKPVKPVKLPAPPPGMLDLTANAEIDPEAVDVLIEVVRCFGPMLQEPEVEALQELLIGILETERAGSVVKKRAVVAVSILALYLTDAALSSFVTHLMESLKNPHLTAVQRRLYITILGSIARSIPTRFGKNLKSLAPFVLAALSQQELEDQLENAAEDGEPDPEIDDVRESALVALEGFLASCGNEMRAYTEETIAAALRFLKYDPNYNDDDDEEMGGTQPEDDDMDDFGDDDDYEAEAGFDDDDDDASWKVRRCAAKTLYTLISTRGSGDLLDDGTLYTQVAPVLVQRFNEREENVRLEVIATMSSLIRKTGEGVLVGFSGEEADYVSHAPQGRKRRRESSSTATFDTKSLLSMSAGLTSPTIEPVPVSGPRADLARLSPAIIKSATKLLKSSSIPTKQALINLLDDIVSVQNGGLGEYFGQIVDPIIDAIKTTTGSTGSSSAITSGGAASATPNTLRVAALRLIGDISKTHSSSVLQPYLPKIVPGVVSAVNDKYYKISSEAIGTVEQLVKALTPPRSRTVNQNHQSDLQQLYKVIIGRVTATDADLEVRQRAIHALGILLARTASPEGESLLLLADREAALQILNDRLKNETTRLAAVRAIDTIAALTTSKDQLKSVWIREVSLELAAQLRKADRALRGASLAALKNLVVAPASRTALDPPTIQGLVSALLPLLTTDDLHLLGPALLVLATLVGDNAKLVVTTQLSTALCGLLTAPLGGAVLEAVLHLVSKIGEKGVGQQLMQGLLADVSINGDPAVVGKVIGTLLVCGGSSVGVSIDNFLTEVTNPSSDDARRSLALAVLGEAGLRLGGKSPLQPSTFTSQFESTSDKVPIAAAIALGRAGAGNVPVYLPEILSVMDKGGNDQYLLLHSIKEILQQASNHQANISKYTGQIWDRLLVASQAEDNKAVGAECIGRIAIIEPKAYMPKLQTLLRSQTPTVRAMTIQAIRYTLADSEESFDAVLKTTLIDMLTTMLRDPELENSRLALTTLNSAAHNKPDLIIPNLGTLLPLVMKESIIKPELIHEIMMGPFKHKVDDGIEVRKSAYETLYSLMEIAFSRINILDFYDRVIAGLQDDHDIRALCNLMLTKLVVLDPDETARRLDAIANCFRAILSIKLKDNAVKQEIEKQEEASRSVLRVTLLLHSAIPGASSGMGVQGSQHQIWRSYWEWVEKDFESQLRALKDEGRE